jgi:hypothetical protein
MRARPRADPGPARVLQPASPASRGKGLGGPGRGPLGELQNQAIAAIAGAPGALLDDLIIRQSATVGWSCAPRRHVGFFWHRQAVSIDIRAGRFLHVGN